MSITVRYFASLKERIGRAEDHVTLTAPLSVGDVWQRLHPDLAIPQNVLAAVNQEYVTLDHLIEDGDELAFFPPVTGG
jgi:sulfur-carrier protein